MKDKFIEVAQQDVSYFTDSPDLYREDADKIERLSKKFEVDMSDRIQGLEDKARELEEEQQPDEPYDREDYGPGDSSDSCSDVDIESLFGTLKS